jgi:opacity protein-like surface antigen
MLAWSSDAPEPPAKPPKATEVSFKWTGGYAGLNAGYTWHSNAADFALFPATVATPELSAATKISSQGFLGGAQAGYNYQIGRIVVGPEFDISSLNQSASSTTTGKDSFGFPYTTTRSEGIDWLGTSRLRLGFTPTERMLLYGTGGIAFGHVSGATNAAAPGINAFGFDFFGLNNGGSASETKVGSTVGAGLEYALSNRLSVKAEYLYYDLGHVTVTGVPLSLAVLTPNRSNTNFDENGQIIRFGLNYQFDTSHLTSPEPETSSKPSLLENITTEFGSRYWWSTGKTVKHLFNPSGSVMNSELTYDDLSALPMELFARADHVSGLFLKGDIGTGAVTGGSLKDEDFPPVSTPYSATVSEQKDGSITYGTIDAGYDFLRNPSYMLGTFVGYNYYHETVDAYGCAQIAANPAECVPAIPDTIQGITNDGTWQSARLGINGEVNPTDRLELTGDVAWLPYTTLSSTDTHWLRLDAPGGFTGPIPEDGTGHTGYQIESILSYQVTPSFSLGLGGRYWYMQVSGKSHFEGNVVDGEGLPQPVNFSSNRYGVFAQAAFKF